MEEIDEAKAKVTASELANANPNSELAKKPSRAREEGELSSSDDGENRICSAAQSTGTVAPPTGPPPVNKGKAIASNNPASSIDIQSRTSIQPTLRKNFEKSRVPLQSATPGWGAPFGANNNLVIRFSDDDSGSDSEEYRQEKALETKGNTTMVDGNRRPPVLPLAKSNKLRQTARNANKVMPKKVSLSRTFMSSTTNIHGTNSRGAGHLLVDQGSRGRNFNTLNKNLASRERGSDQGVGLNNSKLQDLRQQIALRESELKLKSAYQNKEPTSVSRRDNNTMNLNNDTAGKYNDTSSDIVPLEPKEPDKKRLKVGESFNTQQRSGGQREIPAAKFILPSKALEGGSLQDRNKLDCNQKGIPMGRPESTIVKWQKQDDKQVAVLSENIPSRANDGANINTSCNQSDNIRQVDPSAVLNQTTPLANITSSILPQNLNSVELSHPSNIGDHQQTGSFLNKATTENNLIRGNDRHEVISSDKTLKHLLNNICQGSMNNASFWNCLGNAKNVSGHSNINLTSLVEMEESLDKDLEDAQEHRHRCEIGERNALKAYRKAQRALVEANARCTDLYHKRELYSAHLRPFIMENSSLLCSSTQLKHAGIGLDYLNNMSPNVNPIPTSSHQIQPEFDGFNQTGYDSNIQCVNSAPSNTTHRHVSRQNLGSEPCSEPDASTSEPLPHRGKNTADGVCSPSNDPNISADEDEVTFPFDPESIQPNVECDINEEKCEDGQKDINNESNKKRLVESSQDTLLLEATLRNELFARLGTRTSSKNNSSCYDIEPAVEREAENDVGREKTQIGTVSIPEVEKNKKSDVTGTDTQERRISEAPVEIQNQRQADFFSLNSPSTAESEECGISTMQGHHLTTSVFSSPPLILRSAFGHIKGMSQTGLIELQTRKQQSQANDNEEGAFVNPDEIHQSNPVVNSIKDLCGREIGSYTCNPTVDPFWPLCMYELRGKCNNDECPWQHVKDYSNGNIYQHQHDDSDSADSQVGLTLHQRMHDGVTKGPKYHDVMTSPIYLVGLDVLKANPHSYESILAGRSSQWWQKCFSISLAISNLLRKGFPADDPFLHGTDGRIEIHGNWNRQSSYFQSRNGIVNQLEQALADNDQSLEMALLILNQEVDKLEGMKKALLVLSRALEADATSVNLWIVYLVIYYNNTKSFGKDDMFSHAVKQNEGSYALWLLYINSRMQLDDRLVAYDAALKALCHHKSASDRDAIHASACILDLFLQMMDCLCMSGNVEKAIHRCYGHFPATTNSDEPYSLPLSDILTCLTMSDKCVFWVCCVYLVIYRKLPDAVVQRFECEKELLEIEWHPLHLIDEEKQRFVKFVETAVDSVHSDIFTESLKSEFNLRSAQLFALNHVRAMVALDSLDCFKNLLYKYVKLYPSCLELVLISGRTLNHDFGDLSFVGFEEALCNWPKEVPGVQCIWNQYVEYALQNGKFNFAKELMVRWFHSVWKVQYLQNGSMDAVDGGNSCGSLGSASKSIPDTSISNPSPMDLMFGYLNLSLHKLLQNDHIEARLAIDRAMKVAVPGFLKHCVREHAVFLLTDESLLKEDFLFNGIRNILKGYLDDALAFPVSEPLSRKFTDDIKKPRVRQLVSNIFIPVSYEFSLINSVLEVWYGPSLLPQEFQDPKDLVDFVEAILEIQPSNYPLAISLCKQLSRNDKSSDITKASVLFWASSTLVSALFHAIPLPPEYIWVEAAGILGNIAGTEAISERFYKRAFSVYPFSVKLWKSYYNLSKTTGKTSIVVEAAKGMGIQLD